MQMSQSIANTIKKLAKEKNIPLGKMLIDCGISKNAISTMQSQGYLPRLENLIKIADCLDCSIDYLLGRETKMNVENNDVGHIVNNGVNNGFIGDNFNSATIINGDNKEKENSCSQAFPKFDPNNMTENGHVTCGYCGTTFPLIPSDDKRSTYNHIVFNNRGQIDLCLDEYNGIEFEKLMKESGKTYSVAIGRCPTCGNDTICVYEYEYDNSKDILDTLNKVNTYLVKPFSNPIRFPDYVPQQIRKDYEEACAIARLSANAAAVLLRRCLQLMIRDFWKIDNYNLGNAFKTLKREHTEEISDYEILIDALIESGDSGAHPNEFEEQIANVEHVYVEFLINCTEQLIKDWYVKKHEKNKQQSEALAILERFKSARKAAGNTKNPSE